MKLVELVLVLLSQVGQLVLSLLLSNDRHPLVVAETSQDPLVTILHLGLLLLLLLELELSKLKTLLLDSRIFYRLALDGLELLLDLLDILLKLSDALLSRGQLSLLLTLLVEHLLVVL